MIQYVGHLMIITCDKCGYEQSEIKETANAIFFDDGWIMNSSARKYVHLCRACQTPRQKRARDFVRDRLSERMTLVARAAHGSGMSQRIGTARVSGSEGLAPRSEPSDSEPVDTRPDQREGDAKNQQQ